MGNTLATNSPSALKETVSQTTVPPRGVSRRVPNEEQNNSAAAFSLIAYKNQDPTTKSDLDMAKDNFEANYKRFLILFGQYSNTPLVQYGPSGKIKKDGKDKGFEYPITNDTKVFEWFPKKYPL